MKTISNILLAILLSSFCSCDSNDLTEPGDGPDDKTEVTVEPFDQIPSQEEMVVYEVNVTAFSSAGTLNGVKEGLDHIESLGVNVIWLMPIYPIGDLNGIGSPYSIKDYEDVNPSLGDKEALIELVNEAHSRGIAVILDWVANHTAWDHPWITYDGWYTTDNNGNIIAPEGTGWTDVADLNFDNQEMRAAMIASMKYWIREMGIDGFRCDAVDYVPLDFWSEAISSVDQVTEKDLIWLGEGGQAWNFTAGFEFNYAWDYYGKIRGIYHDGESAGGIFTVHSQEMGGVPAGMTKLRYTTNHDMYGWDESVVDVYSTDGSVGAFAATAFMGGIPLIYSGQEVAEPDLISFFGRDPINWSQNPEVLAAYQQIMEVRAAELSTLSGDLESYSNQNAIIFTRSTADATLLIIVNARGNEIAVDLPTSLQNTAWTDLMNQQDVDLESSLSLAAYDYKILKKR